MKTEKIKEFTFKEDCIKEYITDLLKNRFRVFVFENKNIGWFMFSKNNHIGSCQYDFMSSFSFSTKHKANINTGTGYQTETEILKPSCLNAEHTFIKYPYWETNLRNKSSVVKYKDLEEYFKKETIIKYIEIIL